MPASHDYCSNAHTHARGCEFPPCRLYAFCIPHTVAGQAGHPYPCMSRALLCGPTAGRQAQARQRQQLRSLTTNSGSRSCPQPGTVTCQLRQHRSPWSTFEHLRTQRQPLASMSLDITGLFTPQYTRESKPQACRHHKRAVNQTKCAGATGRLVTPSPGYESLKRSDRQIHRLWHKAQHVRAHSIATAPILEMEQPENRYAGVRPMMAEESAGHKHKNHCGHRARAHMQHQADTTTWLCTLATYILKAPQGIQSAAARNQPMASQVL